MDSMQKSGQRLNDCGFNSWELVISRPQKFSISNVLLHLSIEPITALFLRSYITINVSCIGNCIYCTPKQFFQNSSCFPKVQYCNFAKKCRRNREIRATYLSSDQIFIYDIYIYLNFLIFRFIIPQISYPVLIKTLAEIIYLEHE